MRFIPILACGLGLTASAQEAKPLRLGPWVEAQEPRPPLGGIRVRRLPGTQGVPLGVAYRAADGSAFLVVEGAGPSDHADLLEESWTAVTFFDALGHERWHKRFPKAIVGRCHLLPEGRGALVSGRGYHPFTEPGKSPVQATVSFLLALDGEGKTRARYAPLDEPVQPSWHLDAKGTTLTCALSWRERGFPLGFDWTLCRLDTTTWKGWRRAFKGSSPSMEIAAVPPIGGMIFFFLEGHLHAWGPEGKALWSHLIHKTFSGAFSFSNDGQRMLRGGLIKRLACHDGLTGRALWECPAPGLYRHGFVEGTRMAYWCGLWGDAKPLVFHLLDESGKPLADLPCPPSQRADDVAIRREGSCIEVWANGTRLSSHEVEALKGHPAPPPALRIP